MQRHKKLYGLSVLLAVGVGGLSGFEPEQDEGSMRP